MTKNNFYITYYARKHQKFITRKGWFDKPDGTKGKSFVSSQGNPCLIYWDLDQGAWRMAVGKTKIKYKIVNTFPMLNTQINQNIIN